MHTHSEIVIPPTTDIEAAVAQVMKPFNENLDRDDENRLPSFWDFYVIGGRFAGHKLMASYDKAKIDEFYEWLTAEKVTVSGFQAGKQKLQPESQEAKIDAKWNEMFPSEHFVKCPVFQHSNDQYAKDGALSGALPDDVMLLMDVPASLACERIIFAEPSYKNDGTIEPEFMLIVDAWNGCNYMKTDWDGTFGSALATYRKKFEHMEAKYAERKMPQDNWLVVTVDSHS